MLSVLRTARLPARYVCGYIEAVAPPSASANNTIGRAGRTLVGAIATHAWVEVMIPGMEWVALDPTNKQWCGERHITVSRGRDFRDATPVRGTFKGTGKQNMKVKVFVKRRVPPAPKEQTPVAPKSTGRPLSPVRILRWQAPVLTPGGPWLSLRSAFGARLRDGRIGFAFHVFQQSRPVTFSFSPTASQSCRQWCR